MAFYLESEYLDLKKTYQNFSYTALSFTGEETIPEDISNNNYTYIQEKDTLLIDIKNICRFFYLKSIEGLPPLDFPFVKIKDRISYILQKYQEQSVLLDPHIESIIHPIMNVTKEYVFKKFKEFVNDKTNNINISFDEEFHLLLNIVYVLCKVRGFKFINKFFPHEVKDLEPVVFFLISQQSLNTFWESKYIMLLWLSIIILVPFDLATIDSNLFANFKEKLNFQTNESNDLIDNLIQLCKLYLESTTKTRDMAGIVMANLFSRPDLQKGSRLRSFLIWADQIIKSLLADPSNLFFLTGIYNSLVEILKIGTREELLDKILLFIPIIEDHREESLIKNSAVLRQLQIKLAQRLALILLKPRVVAWRYQIPSKALTDNISGVEKKAQSSKLKIFNCETVVPQKKDLQKNENAQNSSNFHQEQESSSYFSDIDLKLLEILVDHLLLGLKDKDTIVRWSSAKGIGRIAGRLDFEMAEDVMNATLECFQLNETDSTWHGGCLTLGELCRRGLLVPSMLSKVLPIIYKALHYDQNQGNFSYGANVRDSACYVVWAFARAYQPEILKSFVHELSQNLLITCVFDREINCRRAAAAAFQEHVGRQGVFPHGIEILTEADYFSLGVKQHAYLTIGPFVASFWEYFSPFVEYLAIVKLKHWDADVRRLSAACLSLLTVLHWDDAANESNKADGICLLWNNIIHLLCKECLNDMVHIRHGALYGLADVLLGLDGKSHMHNMVNEMKDSVFLKSMSYNDRKLMKSGEYLEKFLMDFEKQRKQRRKIDGAIMEEIIEVVGKIDKARLFRGKGGEIMRVAVNRLIEAIAICENIELKESNIQKYIDALDESIKNPLDIIQNSGVEAFQAFSERYGGRTKKAYITYLEKVIKFAKDGGGNQAVMRGYTRILGFFKFDFEKGEKYLDQVFQILVENSSFRKQVDLNDPDTRKFALSSLARLIQTRLAPAPLLFTFFSLAFSQMSDYTTDRRGDIGSIVRENSMKKMLEILILINSNKIKIDDKISQNENDKNSYADAQKNELAYKFVCLVLQQLVEKIDRVRLLAGSIMQEFSENNLNFNFPEKENILGIFKNDNIRELLKKEETNLERIFDVQSLGEQAFENRDWKDGFVYFWNQPGCVFVEIVPLMKFSEYAYEILKGLVISVGGLTESVVKHSLTALQNYVKSIKGDPVKQKELFENFAKIITTHIVDERQIVPTYKSLEYVLGMQELHDSYIVIAFINNLFGLIKKEYLSKSVNKLVALTGIFANFFNFPLSELEKELKSITIKFLVHKFPIVRKNMADKLYLSLAGNEKYDECANFLMEVDWAANLTNEELADLAIKLNELLV